jgi:ferritin-like metal-binding protein YciE
MTKHEQLIAWLGDAHAMEVGIITTLEKHIVDAKGQPQVVSALKKHLGETKKHATAVKNALKSLDAGHPVIREGLSKAVSLVAGLGTSLAQDTPVKNAISDFATEHFEIACYTSLAQTATELGETEIARTCKAILREEEAMARTLKGLFPGINSTYLSTLDDESKGSEERSRTPRAGQPAASKSRKAKPAKSNRKTKS